MKSGPAPRAGLQGNIRLYPWYSAAFHAMFWVPVFFLYFSARLPLSQVLALEAIYYASVVLLETPSGYLSDRVGRRPTLFLSAGSLAVAYTLFAVGGGFGVFAAAQVFLAFGIACNSGTDTSLHYDSLADLGKQEEFAAREAKVARLGFLAGAVAALAGGAAGTYDLRLAYLLSLGAALASLILVARFVEPRGHASVAGPGAGYRGQMAATLALLKDKALGWLLGFYVLMTVVNHIPYEFYQPYLRLLAERGAFPPTATPLAAGLHLMGAMLVAAWLAGHSVRLRDKVGLGSALLIALSLQAAVIAGMGTVLATPVIFLMVLRTVPRALMTAPLNAAIAPRAPRSLRATYLSLQSLVGRLAFAGVLGALALGAGEAADWPALQWMLRASLVIALAGGAALWLSLRALSSPPQEKAAG